MGTYQSDLLRELDARGFIHQCTDLEALDAAAAKGPITAYIGFDLTSDSLHVGSLYPLMMLRILQQTGHRPIVLLGGGTTKVGDPSGKDESRQLMTPERIAANKAGLRTVFDRFFTFGEGGAIEVDNSEWLDGLNYLSMLRDIGPHFTINRMLTFDSVKARLEREQPLTFLEFNYMILQAYDFVELHRRYGCTLQMGASDQWGNIINGVELFRRLSGEESQARLFGLTCPLLTDSQGKKMGKSAAGAVWLNPDKLSDFDFWQFWRNVDDADVPRFLRLFSELPTAEIERLSALEGAEVNEGKKALATAITRLVRGDEAANAAAETARQAFEEGAQAAEGLPRVAVDLSANPRVAAVLVESGLADSNGAAKRHIKGGAVRVNDERVSDEAATMGPEDLRDGVVRLSVGKKNHVLVVPTE